MLFRRIVFAAAAAAALGRANAEPLDAILKRMTADAKKFKSVSASMHQTDYNATLKDSTESSAELHLRRSKGGFSGLINYLPPEVKVVSFSGDTAEVYYPKASQVEKIKAGEYLKYVSQYLLFGASGEDLKKNYSIAPAGTESIDGTMTTHLILTPTSAQMQKMITTLEVWIPEGQSYPLREKATEPSKNAEIFSFSAVKITPPNPPLPDSAFELKYSHDTKVITRK